MSTDVFVKFEYDARDIVYATLLRKRSRLPGPLVLVLGGVALGALGFLLWRMGPVWLRYISAWLVVIVSVHWAFTALRIVPHAMFRKSVEDAAWMRQVRSDFWSRKMSVDASEDGIAVTVGRRSASIKWREFRGIESDARSHLLRHGAAGYLVVPRRAFRTEKKDEAFRELASRLVGAPEPAPANLPSDLAPTPAEAPSLAPRTATPKVGRNDPCPCGSGKKHKKCCLDAPEPARTR